MSEVSCRLVVMIRQMLTQHGANWERVILNIGYPRDYVLNPKNRISWTAYTELCRLVGVELGGLEGVRAVSRRWGVGDQMLPMRRVSRACLSAESFYRLLMSLTLSTEYRNIFKHSTVVKSEGSKTILYIRIDLIPGRKESREWFESAVGVFEGYPNLLGYPSAKVEVLEISASHGFYRVEPPVFKNLWNRLLSWFETPFRVKDTLTAISVQEKALWENFQELERRKNDLEAILKESLDAIALVADGVILYANPALISLLGMSDAKDVIGTKTAFWMETSSISSLRLWAAAGADGSERREASMRTISGTLVPVELTAPRSLQWNNQNATLWMMREVGERRRIEAAAAEAAEREKQRIADDLHDGLGQEMTAIALQLEALKHRLESAGQEEHKDVARLVNHVSAATRHARDISHGLSPRIVVERGLLAGLNWLAAHTGELFSMSIVVRSEITEEELRGSLSQELAVAVYRSAQEVFSNARRHGKASTVNVSLSLHGSELRIEMVDDGQGLSGAPESSEGMGLKILQHRLSGAGGTSSVGPRRDGASGVQVSLSLPYVLKSPLATAPQRQTSKAKVPRTGGPASVMLVDDHSIVRESLSRVLEESGRFKVIARAGTVAEALAYAGETPDVAIVDLFLEGESGLDLLPRLLAQHEGLRAIAFSMGAEELYAAAALKAGAHAFVSKQSEPDALLKTLDAILAPGESS